MLDPETFTLVHKPSNVPITVLQAIHIQRYKDVAGPNEPYSAGCTNLDGLPKCRLNWAATNKRGVWILSIEYGGIGSYTLVHVVKAFTEQVTAESFQGLALSAKDDLRECIKELNAGSLERREL